MTDIPGFHKELERYEIYNGNLDRASFEKVILERFEKWEGRGQIFECSIFQNVMENQILYLMLTDHEILDFYRRLRTVLAHRTYRILYLDVEDIPGTIEVIRRERCDGKGNEMWFPLMLKYLEESPYGKTHMLTGMEGLVRHLERRKALELRVLEEIFGGNALVIKSKDYDLQELLSCL